MEESPYDSMELLFWDDFCSTNGQLVAWVGGLDSCDPLVKGIAAWVYP